MEKTVAGQNELEILYNAGRSLNLPAEQHEKLRLAAQALLAVLQKAEEARGTANVFGAAKADEDVEPGKEDAKG